MAEQHNALVEEPTTARNSKPHGVVAYNRGGPARRTAVPLALTIRIPFAEPSTS